ncbi:MAG TPA: SPOR domain-containing protein, partial [Rhizomicrobium sp.]|nr:SPOR domain-containing protein [Rhizomicrobium sp.]
PEPAPVAETATEVPVEQGDTSLDSVTTSSTAGGPSGWVIQIGATPDPVQAKNLLASAQDKGGKALTNATPFTVAFSSGGSQLYRARFGGFCSQDKAAAACKILKKKGFACWASLQ